ncbi:cell division protein [Tersicoccus phoenicis]|uniref:Cell wall synthesis protein Wag31 n=1 Tax=Tersicoccus phoenicis TaxID=554083 RepID=A0A1R1L9S2_9MICC|nr:DivIVA domain-containing protein [Tersicoccus phoenicis]OMH24277.1 cell division protein [Tersicoccus phoenicis]
MALTPEDVVNKRFQPTKFREGYDQDEVDDFLDEVVVELRRLNQENDELRQRLARSEGAAGETDASIRPTTGSESLTDDSGTGTVAAEGPSAATDVDTRTDTETGGQAPGADHTDTDTPAPVTSAADGTGATTPAADNAAGLLAMAQRIHDEYVNSGIEQRDSIIAEAQGRAEAMIDDAEQKSNRTLSDLEKQKSALEDQVEQLRGFERDYRSRLKEYIESQLRDLESTGSVEQRSDTV